jgi:hypothetical protein
LSEHLKLLQKPSCIYLGQFKIKKERKRKREKETEFIWARTEGREKKKENVFG